MIDIKSLIKDRKEFIASAKKNKFDLQPLLVGLYSDISHFVYEILQNAEDAGSKKIFFTLQTDKLVIRHDGTPFSLKDIEDITGISNIDAAKKTDKEKIGKFGVGFKSVYAITTTPLIQSGQYEFTICDFVVPESFSETKDFKDTIITLPFNHSRRSKDEIYEKIKLKFDELEPFNLLFLKNLKVYRC